MQRRCRTTQTALGVLYSLAAMYLYISDIIRSGDPPPQTPFYGPFRGQPLGVVKRHLL